MLTQARLKQILHYNPETGIFRWLIKISKKNNIGAIAGGLGTKGYWRIIIEGKYYTASRLAWLYMTGEWPINEVDHKNRVRHDNSWDNLRDVTSKFNKTNRKRYYDALHGTIQGSLGFSC